MNRRHLLALLLVLAISLATSPFAPPAGAQTEPPEAVAVTAALEGQVFLLRAGRQIALEPGMAVAESDEVLTFPNGRVRLRFADGSLVTIGPNSRCLVAFRRHTAERTGQVLRLIEGILRVFTAEAAADRIEVRTRSAISTPRGTEWIVERLPGSTAVFVIEGAVAVRGAGDAGVLLGPGFGTDVPDGAPPGVPKRWGQARVEDVLERTHLP
ncbi:MAG: FecR family protein [Tistlia sp.]|uniref:FecR family protein n=1 Tax=Tistlia sp. TaxID=3057121 RepID=UPI0034A512B9